MLSPRAFSLLIRHLDAIDVATSKKLSRRTPWHEETLSQFFCDLFDEESQVDEALGYSLAQLRNDLAAGDEPLSIDWSIRTNQFTKHEERYVTQSDIGLVVEYHDQFDPSFSFANHWLLQAKRLFRNHATERYDGDCEFESFDAAQHQRMLELRQALQTDAILYLLYCPRPTQLDPSVRELLTHERTVAIQTARASIFDFTWGLQLRDDL